MRIHFIGRPLCCMASGDELKDDSMNFENKTTIITQPKMTFMKKVFFPCLLLLLMGGSISAQKLYKPTCTTIAPVSQISGVDTTPGRQVANPYLVWDAGDAIAVKFIGKSSKTMRDMVMRYAKEWELYANIKLKFVPDNTPVTNMRIALGDGLGHNSMVGVNCNDVPQAEQTMNLDTIAFLDYDYYIAEMKRKGIQPNMEDLRLMLKQSPPRWNMKEIKSTVLHEFGHALGMLHEQSYPGAIKWNVDTVYKYYEKTQGWDKGQVDFNVLEASNQFYTNGTQYDPKSIMHYSVEAWQTVDGYSLPANYELSPGDKSLIAALYPRGTATTSLKGVPRVTITNFSNLQAVNDPVKGGIKIYPSFDLKTTAKLGTVYVLAMLIDESGNYIKDNNDYYNWGGFVAVYPKLTLTPNAKTSYNKLKKNLELFLPYSEIPVKDGQKVKFRFSVVLQDAENNQWIYVMNHFTQNLFSIKK